LNSVPSTNFSIQH